MSEIWSISGAVALWIGISVGLWWLHRRWTRARQDRRIEQAERAVVLIDEAPAVFDLIRATVRLENPPRNRAARLRAETHALLKRIQERSSFFDSVNTLRVQLQASLGVDDHQPLSEMLHLRRDLWAASEIVLVEDPASFGATFARGGGFRPFPRRSGRTAVQGSGAGRRGRRSHRSAAGAGAPGCGDIQRRLEGRRPVGTGEGPAADRVRDCRLSARISACRSGRVAGGVPACARLIRLCLGYRVLDPRVRSGGPGGGAAAASAGGLAAASVSGFRAGIRRGAWKRQRIARALRLSRRRPRLPGEIRAVSAPDAGADRTRAPVHRAARIGRPFGTAAPDLGECRDLGGPAAAERARAFDRRAATAPRHSPADDALGADRGAACAGSR